MSGFESKNEVDEIERPRTKKQAMQIFEITDDDLWEGVVRIHWDHGYYLYYRLVLDIDTWVEKVFVTLRDKIFYIMKKIPPGENNNNLIEDFAVNEFGWEGEIEYNSAMCIQ